MLNVTIFDQYRFRKIDISVSFVALILAISIHRVSFTRQITPALNVGYIRRTSTGRMWSASCGAPGSINTEIFKTIPADDVHVLMEFGESVFDHFGCIEIVDYGSYPCGTTELLEPVNAPNFCFRSVLRASTKDSNAANERSVPVGIRRSSGFVPI